MGCLGALAGGFVSVLLLWALVAGRASGGLEGGHAVDAFWTCVILTLPVFLLGAVIGGALASFASDSKGPGETDSVEKAKSKNRGAREKK
jgi:hypothetical protein